MNTSITPEPPYRWRQSLILRVILLCVVLVLCLLGSVYVITRHYVSAVIQEMESEAQHVADQVQVLIETGDHGELEQLADHLSDVYRFVELEDAVSKVAPAVTLETDETGQVMKVARTILPLGEREVLLTVRVPLAPTAEIVRVFKNKFLTILTIVFLVALVLMVYFIARTLRPLRDLTESCAQISAGNLQPIEVRKTYGEIQSLETTFNRMVTSLLEKEEMEVKLRQAQRLSALGNLAAGVAHDVRNPLNAIKLLSGHVVDNLNNGADTGAAARHIHTIRQEADRIEGIVSGFLSLAREHELQPEPAEVDTLLEECLHLVQKDAESRNVRLLSDLRAGDTTLMLDPKQWKRAMLNVLLNAMDACPPGGRVRLFSRLTDSTCEVEVRDDGPGMSREVLEHCFDPYFSTKAAGTGLGLSITRGIVEEHGAEIQISSEEGQGCQVLIVLPLEMKVL